MKYKIFFLILLALFLSACANQTAPKTVNEQVDSKNTQNKNMLSENNDNNQEETNIDLSGKSLDVESSSIAWTGKAVGRGHTGTIRIKSGNLDLEGGQLNSGELVIDMTTIKDDGGSERLENHLRSKDFFDVQNFSEARIKTKEIEIIDESTYRVSADLEIKGISNPVEFTIAVSEEDGAVKLQTELSIDRSLWDVRYGSDSFFDNLGDSAISDEIDYMVILVLK